MVDKVEGKSGGAAGGPGVEAGADRGGQAQEAVDPKEGWNTPVPERLPAPTYWPVVMSLGIAFVMWGIVTTVLISAVGLVLFVVALVGWIGDIRHEAKHG